MNSMKVLNLITLILIVIGGINWGLVGFFHFDLVAAIFGGPQAAISRIIYSLIGLSALYQLYPLSMAFSEGEITAERAHS